jgi:hypothetical protein
LNCNQPKYRMKKPLLIASLFLFILIQSFAIDCTNKDSTKKYIAKIYLKKQSIKGVITELRDSSIIVSTKEFSELEIHTKSIKTIKFREQGTLIRDYYIRPENIYVFSLPAFIGGIIYGHINFEDTGRYLNTKPFQVFLFATVLTWVGSLVGLTYNTINYFAQPFKIEVNINYSQKEYHDAQFILKQYAP